MSKKVILCFDYGTKRIGIACSDENYDMAFPYASVNSNEARKIERIIDSFNVECLVVGWPNINHEISFQYNEKIIPDSVVQKEILSFAYKLSQMIKVDIIFFDESYSSVKATEMLNANKDYFKYSAKSTKYKLTKDKLSAYIILQSFLEYIAYNKKI